MQVELVSITEPKINSVITNAEELIVYCARVSNPSNQLNVQTAPKLIKYLIDHKHFSPFEMVNMCVKIETSRAIAAQILRHRSFSFQEFCISGDSMISFDLPHFEKDGKRKHYKLSIKNLYDKWHNGALPIGKNKIRIPMKNRIQQMKIRVYDEKTNQITNAKIIDIYKTGVKPLYEVEFYNGKKIKCTKEHKFLTKKGFVSFEKAVGLVKIKNTIGMKRPNEFFATNGIPLHQSYDWMKIAKKESILYKKGISYISDKAGVSYHTIKKWLKKHNLSFTKKEVSKYSPIWNKRIFGYKRKPHSEETIEKMRKSARKGKNSNLWKGGVNRSERAKISDWFYKNRREFFIKTDYKCQRCKSSEKLELHHIKPVYSHPELAYDKNNIEVLCKVCHRKHHSMCSDYKKWRKKSKSNKLTVEWVKVKNIKYIGEEMTYDLEIDHDSHNYVANGIIVHNSQRYSVATELENIELRKQGKTNRQVGDEPVDIGTYVELKEEIDQVQHHSLDLYNKLIAKGIAKECARMILPLNTKTVIFMSGTIRSWIHFLEIRTKEDTQKEHRQIALEVQKIFIQNFPNISSALNWAS